MPHFKFDDVKVCHKCDHLDAQAKPKLTWPPDLWDAWRTITRVNMDLEVLALFRVDKDNLVTELEVPEQEVEQAACKVLKQDGHWDGMIHSHHNMGAFMSGDDKATLMPNYRFSMVTNHKGEVLTFEKIDLPCGGIGFKEVETLVQLRPEAAELVALVKERARRPVPKQTSVVYGGYAGNYGTHWTPAGAQAPKANGANGNGNGAGKSESKGEQQSIGFRGGNSARRDDSGKALVVRGDDGVYRSTDPTDDYDPYSAYETDPRFDQLPKGEAWGCEECHIHWDSWKAAPYDCWFCHKRIQVVTIDDGETWYDAQELGRLICEDVSVG